MKADLARDEAKNAPPPSIEAVLKLVDEIDQAKEDLTTTAAFNENGVERIAGGGNSNCYIEIPAGKGDSEKARVAVTRDWSRTDAVRKLAARDRRPVASPEVLEPTDQEVAVGDGNLPEPRLGWRR